MRAVYEEHLAGITDRNHADSEAALKQYGAWLAKAESDLRKVGDLDRLLAVQSERKRFANDRVVPDNDDPSLLGPIARMREAYRAQTRQDALTNNRRVVTLTQKYIASLQEKTRTLTQAGKIDDALTGSAATARA